MYPIIGSEAIAAGLVTRGQLRWNYRRLHRDVYVHRSVRPSVWVNAYGAWLATGRTGVVTGLAAAALDGARTVPDDVDVEIIAAGHRRRDGIVVLNEAIADDEICPRGFEGLRITSPARTALEIARRLPRDEAVPHLDALAAKTRLTPEEALAVAKRYPGIRNACEARESLWLLDGGAASVDETRVRLMLHDVGLAPPATDFLIGEGWNIARIAMGWRRQRVAVTPYTEPRGTPANQRDRLELLQHLNWVELIVLPHDHLAKTAHRVRRALWR
jgi:hypothetical protein